MKDYPFTVLVAVLLGLTILVNSGCPLRPQAEPSLPDIPEALGATEGQEPRLRVYMHDTGNVVEMDFEEYIEGVVAAEMDPRWPENALAAQAIIARTFTLNKIQENGGVPERNAHASTDIEEFQAYNADEVTDKVKNAVKRSRGQVIVHQGNYIRAWFHAYAGPRTALADEGLEFEDGNPPYIQVVDSPGVDIIPEEERDWSASFSLDEVREAARETTGNDPGPVEEVAISEKGPSGRATSIKINDQEVPAASFRLALGSTVMRSTMIEKSEIKGGTLNLSGTGYGHGVGMCQWGARALSEDGLSCDRIVDYFYRDVDIISLWD